MAEVRGPIVGHPERAPAVRSGLTAMPSPRCRSRQGVGREFQVASFSRHAGLGRVSVVRALPALAAGAVNDPPSSPGCRDPHGDLAAACVAAQDGRLLAREPASVHDKAHRIIHAHVERIVRAHEEMPASVLPDEVFQLVSREDNGVEVEPCQIACRAAADTFPTIRAHAVGVIHASGIGWQEAAPVRDEHLQTGMGVKAPSKMRWLTATVESSGLPMTFMK